MRLTLRTLLAYLDGNLEPEDSQSIGKKIEESEFATRLVHLIRDCTRRLRLGAPELMGRGLGNDPNTVAEYLEYRLSDDRVPEFERVCLESETHLAEVASCHQILTLVLGEPAEIDPHTRQRLYALAAHADAPPPQVDRVAAPQGPPIAPPAAPSGAIPPAPPRGRPRPEVPDYLRESRWNWWPVAALVLIAAALTFGGLFAFGPAEWRERLVGVVGGGPAANPAELAPGVSDGTANATDADDPAADAAVEPNEPAPPATDETGAEAPAEDAGQALPDDAAVPVPSVEPPDEPSLALEPQPPLPPADAEGATAPDDLPISAEGTPLEPAPGDPPAGASVARQPAAGFGRFISKYEVLLRFDPATKNWFRLPANAPLSKGDRLLSPPAFRPTITLSSNLTIQSDGPSLMTLEGWTDDGMPILALEYGRLLMLTIGTAGNPLLLKIDGHEPLLTFVDPESTLALEVRRDLAPGANPEAAPATLSAHVYATSGQIRVQASAAASPLELQAPSQLSLVSETARPLAGDTFPAWVSSEEKSDFDRLATSPIDGYLTGDSAAALQLRELADPDHRLGRRREVRALAMLCLMYLDDFDPAVAAMKSESERLFWPVAMEQFRAAVARSPQTAARVRGAFEQQRGPEGAILYRTLWGYSPADLRNGADRELVEGLINGSLDVRVMCFLTLKDLTGTGATHGYRPDDQETIRNRAYNTWKKQIGKIGQRPAG